MNELGSALVVHRKRGRAGPAASVVFALMGVLLLTAHSPAERVVGGVCAAGFGLTAVLLALPRRTTPALVLDAHGLTDAASGAAAGFVAWSAVTGVVEQRLRGQRYLSVLVADPNAVLARVDPAVRAAMRGNLALLDTPVNIPMRPLPIGVAELALGFARRTPSALPAALRARLPADVQARPPATDAMLADLAVRTAAVGVSLPEPYLRLLGDQDGHSAGELRVFGSHPNDRLDGVLEANLDWRTHPDAEHVASEHVVLAEDNAHRYTAHVPTGTFQVLARSDHRSMARLSTFSDLMVAAIEEFPRPLG